MPTDYRQSLASACHVKSSFRPLPGPTPTRHCRATHQVVRQNRSPTTTPRKTQICRWRHGPGKGYKWAEVAPRKNGPTYGVLSSAREGRTLRTATPSQQLMADSQNLMRDLATSIATSQPATMREYMQAMCTTTTMPATRRNSYWTGWLQSTRPITIAKLA